MADRSHNLVEDGADVMLDIQVVLRERVNSLMDLMGSISQLVKGRDFAKVANQSDIGIRVNIAACINDEGVEGQPKPTRCLGSRPSQ